jgi:hypothetical protein
MKKNRLLLSVVVLLSLSTYLFLQYEQKEVLNAREATQEVLPEVDPDPISVQPDIFLIKALVESVGRLLPAS